MIAAERQNEELQEACTLARAVLDVGGRWRECTDVLRIKYNFDLIQAARLAQRCFKQLDAEGHGAAQAVVRSLKDSGSWRLAD